MLRLNYRGSAGYDREFIEARRGVLSGRLQQDVLDAARWAVAEGYAARDRIALYGGSFGGFLALVMLGRHPGAFRAGVALNPIADAVSFWKRDWSRESFRTLWREFLARRDLPEAALARISPANNIRNFDAPVLLLVGTRDKRGTAGSQSRTVRPLALGGQVGGTRRVSRLGPQPPGRLQQDPRAHRRQDWRVLPAAVI